MFLLSFVKGSKSAEGGPNPLADLDRGGPNPLGHRRQMWVEYVGSLLSTERFSPGTPVSPLFKNQI